MHREPSEIARARISKAEQDARLKAAATKAKPARQDALRLRSGQAGLKPGATLCEKILGEFRWN